YTMHPNAICLDTTFFLRLPQSALTHMAWHPCGSAGFAVECVAPQCCSTDGGGHPSWLC
ncbi:hypothetical protein TCSYLVIO_002619, partial [Trypanosoma cruzi]